MAKEKTKKLTPITLQQIIQRKTKKNIAFDDLDEDDQWKVLDYIESKMLNIRILCRRGYDIITKRFFVFEAFVERSLYSFSMKKFEFEPLKKVKRSIIVDKDIGPDCDDVGALVVLHRLAQKYDIQVLGIINCTSNPYGTGAIDVVSTFCGNKDIPIGMYTEPGFLYNDDAMAYNKYISEHFNFIYFSSL